MKGYVIANVEVNDPVGYEAYRSQTAAIVASYGGRFLVRGGAVEAREGNPGTGRLVVIEFPSVDDARIFYESPEYQAIVPLRQANAQSSLCIVDGAV